MIKIEELIKAFTENLTAEEQALLGGTYASGQVHDPNIDVFERELNAAVVEKDGQKLVIFGNFICDLGYICGGYEIIKILSLQNVAIQEKKLVVIVDGGKRKIFFIKEIKQGCYDKNKKYMFGKYLEDIKETALNTNELEYFNTKIAIDNNPNYSVPTKKEIEYAIKQLTALTDNPFAQTIIETITQK